MSERGIEYYNDQFTPADTLEAQMYINYCIENDTIINMESIDDDRLVTDLILCKLVLIEKIRRKDRLLKHNTKRQ